MVLGPPRKLSAVSRNRRSDFTAFFAADFLAAGVFAAEDILSNKKGCWQPGLSSVLSVTECLNLGRKMINILPYLTLTSKWNTVG
jgi:hypothetical protein